jgi:hypothetical protein
MGGVEHPEPRILSVTEQYAKLRRNRSVGQWLERVALNR